jgi:hypothetical protein
MIYYKSIFSGQPAKNLTHQKSVENEVQNKEVVMAKKLIGNRAVLLAEACKLTKAKKEAEERIKEIKEELGPLEAGDYINKAGDILSIIESQNYTELNPKQVLEWLKKQRMGKLFFTVVKIQLTPLKKVMPETQINKLRNATTKTFRYSFK